MTKKKRVFVTVGTTHFDELIETVSKPEILEALKNLGYTEVQFQTGTSSFDMLSDPNITLLYDKYFEDFGKQIEIADLVISHAGAGSCLEVLRKQKPLIVVINENLMNNHQTELAEQLESDGYLYFCTCQTLKNTLCKDLNLLKLYPTTNENLFGDYLDKCMGFI
ncbi:Glycosyltransferase [Oryctes borbonicus]|uniref:UDP-N-acetylglucosamine transferase subunit ALG13 n=1 Tax=Oryctes borbonicus TaxID=1629725 RepID=A0A0T6AYS4_9SCAR|nr:Glycosyltransferase [Oryctes borbonicus]